MLIFFLLQYVNYLIAARWDQVDAINVNGGQGWGHWQADIYCPDGSWVRGFRHKTDTNTGLLYDDAGTILVEITCFDLSGNNQGIFVSNDDQSGSSWSNSVACSPQHNFIKEVNQKVGAQSVGVTGYTVKCVDGTELVPGNDYPGGSYQGYSSCPDESAICGIKSYYQPYEGSNDDSALDDLMIYCCRTCDQASGRYIDTSTIQCKICHYTCKTCDGGSISNCLSCYHSGTPVLNACPSPSYLYEVEGSSHSPSGWTGYPSTTLSSCGSFITGIFGGYNIFGKDGYAKKSYSSLPPHFKKRIRVRFVKIDSWDSENAYVYLDSTQIMSKTFNNNDGFLSGSCCGTNSLDYDYVLEAELTNSLQSFFIKITTNLNELADNESWGFSDFYLGILKCDSTCASCTDQNPNSCSTCYPNASPTSGVCSCNDCYYMVKIANCVSTPCSSCLACYTGCKKCTGSNIGDCQSCISDYYFYSGTCYFKHCPASTFGNNATLTCDASCDGVSEYVDLTDRICKTCDPTCLTCSEKLYTNCRSCLSPRFLSIETPNTDGQCINPCISPKFAHFPTRTCWTLCPLPSWGRISDRICYDDCLNTLWYKDSSDRICKNCHSSCLTCSGPLDSDCLTCGGTTYLYGGKCLSDCGEGKYGDSTTNTCKNCNTNCKTCKTPNEVNTCLTCPLNWYLISTNVCINPVCASNQYRDFGVNNCKACHSTCFTCFAGTAFDCLTCTGTNFYYEPDHSCITNCPAPYYAYNSDNKCYKTCPTNYYGRNTSRTCETTCLNTNEYADPSDRICRTCNIECKTCKGLTNQDCINCDNDRYLKNAQCVLSCGSGMYGDSVNRVCNKCTSPCIECMTDGPSKCTKCSTSNLQKYRDLNNNECVQKCTNWGRDDLNECNSQCASSHQYGDPADRVCKECDSSCKTCNELGCLSCNSGLFLYMKTCISKCPTDEGYWGNTATNECVKCDPTCNKCYGSLPNNCISCLLPLRLLQEKCVNLCPLTPQIMYLDLQLIKCVENCQEGYFPDKESQNCLKCHVSCKNCSKGSERDCTGCMMTSLFNPSLGTCSEMCQDGYFKAKLGPGLYSTNCTVCDSTCAKCIDYKEKCLSCAPGNYPYYAATWLCVPCTLQQQFADPADGQCKICNVGFCSVCISMDLCRSCIEGYYVSSSTDRDFCLEKIKVRAILDVIRNPKLFKLTFSDDWDEFFENFNTTLSVTIDSVYRDGYKHETISTGKPKEFYVQLNISTKIPLNSRLTVYMNPQFESNRSKYFKLMDTTLFAYLDEYIPCEAKFFWSWDKKYCVPSQPLTPSLTNDDDPNTVVLNFDVDAPSDLLTNLEFNTIVTLPELNIKYSHSYVFYVGNYRKVTVELTFEKEYDIKPTFVLEFALTKKMSLDDSFYLTKTKINITLPPYNQLSTNLKKSVKTAAQTTERGAQIAQVLMIAQNIMNVGSMVAVKSLILMELIRFLRFVQINYPANARQVFETQFNPPDIVNLIDVIPKLNIEEDPRDPQPEGLFKEYEVSSYILNNSGNFLMNCVGFWILGCFVLFVGNCFKHTRLRLVMLIIEITRQIFVWNYVLSTFLSSYQNTILYVGVALKWNSFKSDKGIANFILSLFAGLFALVIPLVIFKQVNKARVWQDETEIERKLRLASLNSKKLTQIQTMVPRKTLQEEIVIESARDSNEDSREENFSPLLDIQGLPQRQGKKKQSTIVNTTGPKRVRLFQVENEPRERPIKNSGTSLEGNQDTAINTLEDTTPSKKPVLNKESSEKTFMEQNKQASEENNPRILEEGERDNKPEGIDKKENSKEGKEEIKGNTEEKEQKKAEKFNENEEKKEEILDDPFIKKKNTLALEIEKKDGNDEENKDNNQEEAPIALNRSSFVNLWDMLRKKDKPKKDNQETQRKSIKPARKSVLNQMWDRMTGKKAITLENEEIEKPSKPVRKSFSERFFDKIKGRKSVSMPSENAPEKEISPEKENLVPGAEDKIETNILTRQKTRKSFIERAMEFIYDPEKAKANQKIEDAKKAEQLKIKKENELIHEGQSDQDPGYADTKFGRKTLGKLNPWEEGDYQLVATGNTTASNKKDITKFGRKSRGKITPWDEFSSGSFNFMRKSMIHFGDVMNNMRAPVSSKEMNERYKIFNRDMKFHNPFQKNFMLFDLLRQLIIVITLLSLEEWPLTSVSIITSTNGFMILLVVILRPYESLKNMVQTLVNEMCLLTACISALVLSVFDKNNEQDFSMRMTAGWVIVYANMTLIYFFMTMSLLDILGIIKNSILKVRKYYEQRYTSGLSTHQKKKRRENVLTNI